MARKRMVRIVWLSIIGTLIAVGTAWAYRAFMAPWRGDVKEPLIAAMFVGVAYFIFATVGLRLAERREELIHRDRQG